MSWEPSRRSCAIVAIGKIVNRSAIFVSEENCCLIRSPPKSYDDGLRTQSRRQPINIGQGRSIMTVDSRTVLQIKQS